MDADHGGTTMGGGHPGFGPGSAAVVIGTVGWHLQDARKELAKLTDAGGEGVEPHREALKRLDEALVRDGEVVDFLRRLLEHQANPP